MDVENQLRKSDINSDDLKIEANLKADAWKRSFFVSVRFNWHDWSKQVFEESRQKFMVRLGEEARIKVLKDVYEGDVAKRYQFDVKSFGLSRMQRVKKGRKLYATGVAVFVAKISSDAFLPQNILEWGNDVDRIFTQEAYKQYLTDHHIDTDETTKHINQMLKGDNPDDLLAEQIGEEDG